MKAFITSRNRPKVKIVTGIVKMISIGFTIAFKTANEIATKKADRKSSTLTPGKSQAEISTAKVDRNILPKNCLFEFYLIFEQ